MPERHRTTATNSAVWAVSTKRTTMSLLGRWRRCSMPSRRCNGRTFGRILRSRIGALILRKGGWTWRLRPRYQLLCRRPHIKLLPHYYCPVG